jgi:imidazolonepropionase-like amidohydrolase
MKKLLALILLSQMPVVLFARPQQSRQPKPLVFTHVTVIDTATASTQEDLTVVIVGDHIADVGKAAEIKVPSSTQVVDCRGKFLMPGLWDMHVHTFTHGPNPSSTQTWFFPLFIANGVTGVRDMWTTANDFPQVIQWRKGLADGSLLVPRYGAVGWVVDGPIPTGIHGANPDMVTTPQEAREFVRRVHAAGLDFIKVYDHLSRETYFAIADESKKTGIPFAGHLPFAVKAAEASDAGQRSVEHLFGIDFGCSSREDELQTFVMQGKTWGPEQRKEMLDTFDRMKCELLLEKLARNETWQVPTLGVSVPRVASDPRTKYIPLSLRAPTQPERPTPAGGPETPTRNYRSNLVAMMNKAGVPLLAGTDVSKLSLFPGFSLQDQLVIFVRAGLTPGEALKTATYNPAKFLGMLDRLGTVEKGKLADLVLLDANPLEDIHNTQKIRAVVLNGRYLDRVALDKLLIAAEENARAAPQKP